MLWRAVRAKLCAQRACLLAAASAGCGVRRKQLVAGPMACKRGLRLRAAEALCDPGKRVVVVAVQVGASVSATCRLLSVGARVYRSVWADV